MSDGGESNLVELTVIRADGLEHHQRRGYFVECSNGVETHKTKTRKQTGKDWTVEWKETLSLINDTLGSKFSFRVFLKNLAFVLDDEKACADIVLSDHKIDEEIMLQLASPDHKKPKRASGVLAIKYRLIAQANISDRIVHNVAKASLQVAHASEVRLDALGAIGSGAKQIASAAELWGSLVDNIEFFANFVNAFSEIHPYAKAALSVVMGVTEIFIAQIKRDDSILNLVEAINDTYDLIREGDPLAKRDLYKKQFNVMATQTLECSYFIHTYVKNSFFKRAMISLNPRIDNTIKSFQAQFENLAASFINHTLLDSTIQVYRVMDAAENLEITIDLNDITYAEGMRYQKESCCLPETRKDILEMIIKWADDIDSTEGSRVFLLTGLAGSGKSSIAHSVAQHFDNLHRLGSSFFCNRTKAANSRPEKIFCTVARDIADIEEQARRKLAEVVNNNRSLCKTTSVKEQFVKFLKGSTEGLRMVGPLVIVIDALDECEGDDRLRKELMNMLANEAWTLSKNIRIFLTARSGDPVITNAFKIAPHVRQYSTENIQSGSTNADILVRIENQLSSVADELSEYDIEWKKRLMKMSGGLFIWAVTACNLISGSLLGPKSQLHDVLSVKHAVDNPLVGLYELYEQVLRIAIDAKSNRKEMDLYRTTLGAILGTFKPLPTKAIEDLTGENCRMVVSRLGAVLTGSANVIQPVEVLHTSFRDYLTDPTLSKAYFVDIKKHHSKMAKYCLDMMNRQLKFNVCGFDDPFTLYEDMPKGDLSRMIDDNISEALRYACRYWPLHIIQMDFSDYNIVKESIHRFLFIEKHLMQWLEVVSMLKMMDIILKSMNGLVKWFTEEVQNEQETRRMVYDCFRFLDSFSYPITRGPLLVYHSAVPYIPRKTVLCDVYHETSGLEPQIIFGREESWSSRRSLLQINGSQIKAAAISHDGARVACLSNDRKLQVLDFTTSAPLGKPMEFFVEDQNALDYTSLTFSPDGIYLAMATPLFIDVWDIETRTSVFCDNTFTTVNTPVLIAFFSKRHAIACRKNGTSLELCTMNLSNRESVYHSCTVGKDIRCIGMSPSGCFAGCIIEEHEIYVWDTQSKAEIACFNVKDNPDALGISFDGEYVAASINRRVTMFRRGNGDAIWSEECGSSVNGILMPLLTDSECKKFMTSGLQNCVWDIATGHCYATKSKWAKAISPDEQYYITERGYIVNVGEDTDQPLWEASSGASRAEANSMKPTLLSGESFTQLLFLTDGSLSAAGRNCNIVFFWDKVGTVDARKGILEGHTSDIWDVKISPNGVMLASWDAMGNIFIWTRESTSMQFKPPREHKLESSEIKNIAFSPDESLLIVGVTADHTIYVWEQFGTENAIRYTLKEHVPNVMYARFSADGMKVGSLSKDNTFFVSARTSCNRRFELLLHKRDFVDSASALKYFRSPLRWGEDNAVFVVSESLKPKEQQLVADLTTKPHFICKELSQWVQTAEGKRFWWIPGHFRGPRYTLLGKRMVVYNGDRALMFNYPIMSLSHRAR